MLLVRDNKIDAAERDRAAVQVNTQIEQFIAYQQDMRDLFKWE